MGTLDFDSGAIVACVFDAYGTLFDVAAPAAATDRLSHDQTAALADLWRRKQLEYTWLRSLMGAHADFWRVTGDALDYALEALGLDAGALRGPLLDAYRAPPAFPDVPAALQRLRTMDLGLAILSNGTPAMLDSAVHAAGLAGLFDAILSVETVGVFKPHPLVYRQACETFGAEPAAIVFVSSNPWDAAGAARFGFRTVWVDRVGRPADRLPGRPTAAIASLKDLPGLLGLGDLD
jgi:2-haloacid dehalogenase